MTEIASLTILVLLILAVFLAFLAYVAWLYNQTYTRLLDAAEADPATAFSAFGRTINTIISAAVVAFVAIIVFALTKQEIMTPAAAAPIFAGIIGYVAGAAQTFVTSRRSS